MAVEVDKLNLVKSVDREILRSKSSGMFDLRDLLLFAIIEQYQDFVSVDGELADYGNDLKELRQKVKANIGSKLCNYKTILPTVTITDEESIPTPTYTAPVVVDFTVTTTPEATLLPAQDLYDVYQFNISDLDAIYSDDNDGQWSQLLIDLTSLDNGSLKFTPDLIYPSIYSIFAESQSGTPVYFPILRNDVNKVTFFTDTSLNNTHAINFKLVDAVDSSSLHSNIGVLTIDRTASTVANQPPTIGDITIYPSNRVTTILTLDMFTTSLTPPYNDPEMDLIDAIRVDEVSTANEGQFLYNGNPVVVGQIITREDLIAELFTHEGADVNTIQTDSINFSARDEGSQIWVQ